MITDEDVVSLGYVKEYDAISDITAGCCGCCLFREGRSCPFSYPIGEIHCGSNSKGFVFKDPNGVGIKPALALARLEVAHG